MLAGVGLTFGSILLISQAETLWQIATCFAAACVGIAMYGVLPVQVLLVKWFVRRRGTAISLAMMGISVGGMLTPFAVALLFDSLGWRASLVLLFAVAGLITTPLIALFVVRSPEDVGQYPDGIAIPKVAQYEPPTAEIPLRAIALDSNFWAIGIGSALSLCVTIGSGVFFVRHFEELGISRADCAVLMTSISAFSIVGKMFVGWLADRINLRFLLVATNLLHALSLAIIATETSFVAMLIATIPAGLGAGGFLPLKPVLQGACFGRHRIGRIAGLHAAMGLPFMVGAAPAVGYLADRAEGFTVPYLGMAATLLLAATVLVYIRFPTTPEAP
jgi:MFS family permease